MWSNFMCTQDPFSHAGSHIMVASFTALQLFSAYNLVTLLCHTIYRCIITLKRQYSYR